MKTLTILAGIILAALFFASCSYDVDHDGELTLIDPSEYDGCTLIGNVYVYYPRQAVIGCEVVIDCSTKSALPEITRLTTEENGSFIYCWDNHSKPDPIAKINHIIARPTTALPDTIVLNLPVYDGEFNLGPFRIYCNDKEFEPRIISPADKSPHREGTWLTVNWLDVAHGGYEIETDFDVKYNIIGNSCSVELPAVTDDTDYDIKVTALETGKSDEIEITVTDF